MPNWPESGLARLRQGLYRFFAAALLYPDETRLALLAEASRFLDREGLHAFSFYGPWAQLRKALEALANQTAANVAAEYVRLFIVSPDGALCPPQESFYLAGPGPATGLLLAQVELAYARMGIAPSADQQLLPDHASVELEAMAFLCAREAQARTEKAFGDVAKARVDQRAFLEQHLGRWFPAFARRVMTVGTGGFYGLVVAAADAFVEHDRDLLSLLTQRSEEAWQVS